MMKWVAIIFSAVLMIAIVVGIENFNEKKLGRQSRRRNDKFL